MICARVVQGLPGWLALAAPIKAHHLPQEAEEGLMRHQRQHDKISIQAIQAVALVGRVVGTLLGHANVLHDLVLTFAWHLMACMPHMSDGACCSCP